jgi:hypothetical protein
MIGQSQPLPSRPADPGDGGAAAGYRARDAVQAPRVSRPIDLVDVTCIASAGYPLWEPLEVMQLRNRRITVGYSDLSERLATVLARGDDRRDANWCTFATWTSKTVGTWIEEDVTPAPLLLQLRRWPRPMAEAAVGLTQWLLQRENGASYRCLAAGNRFVFLEVGQAIALFIQYFEDVEGPDEKLWETYWAEIRATIRNLRQLDPSWLITEPPAAEDLRLGLRQYYEALFAADRKVRAEHILAGTLLMGVYEQTRVDGYVDASIALFTERAMRQLVRRRTGDVGGLLRWPTAAYASLMTRGLVLDLPDQRLQVAAPLPLPPDGSPLFPDDLEVITLPLLQALLTRWDSSDGRAEGRRARNWADLNDRMNYITNLFRSRQQHQVLFSRPFPPEVERELCEGRLA